MADAGVSTAEASFNLRRKYDVESGMVYLTGVQALVRLPVEQMRADHLNGWNTSAFISGYPGSPLGGFDLELERNGAMLEANRIVHQPGLNEELAATSVMGSQQAPMYGVNRFEGVLGIWYGKSPGVDRASDALRHANFVGSTRRSGALVLVGDDPSCKSSSIPNSSERVLADMSMPVLAPGNPQEVIDLGLHSVALSRASGLWVGIKVPATLADGAGTVEIGLDRIQPVFAMNDDGTFLFGRDLPAALSPAQIVGVEREMQEVRLEGARRYLVDNGINVVTHQSAEDWIGLVVAGHLYYEVMESLQRLGISEDDLGSLGIRVLHLRALFPLDQGKLREFAKGLDEVVVIEEKRPFVELVVLEALYSSPERPRVLGHLDENGAVLIPSFGALDADTLTKPLVSRLTSRIDVSRLTLPRTRTPLAMVAPPRTPYFCSGCPHNTSLKVPEGELVGAGIGCHSMVAFLDEARSGKVTGVTQMGGEGAQWIGAAPFVEAEHFTQNLGDGTYFHSGQLAVQAALAANSNITYKILYNRAVAMTGGQDPCGELSVPQMAYVLVAQGVKKLIITTEDLDRYRGVRLPDGVKVWDRHRIIEAQEELRSEKGVTVLIHDQQCAAEARRLRKRGLQPEPTTRVAVSKRVCEGCGDCGSKSNCLSLQSVSTEFGKKIEIDQTSCNRDYSCLDGDCPSFITLKPTRRSRGRVARASRRATSRSSAPRLTSKAPVDIPDPVRIVPEDDFIVRMPGIGGTGVVTVAQVLGVAATIEGKFIAGLDQTGLAQKGGSVISDLRISTAPFDEVANKATAGSADLYLVFDLLVGLWPSTLSATSPDRTVAVVATTQVPTGQMIGRPNLGFPSSDVMNGAIEAQCRAAESVFLDPAVIAESLFGRRTTANVFMVGVAYQLGALPLMASNIERALELNGVAVVSNIEAFRWGRTWVADRARLEAALSERAGEVRPASSAVTDLLMGIDEGELGRILRVRVADLIGYQDVSYAKRYVELVRKVHVAESAVTPEGSALSEAVATNLAKLMAYKDEYEVARLLLMDVDATIASVPDGQTMALSFNLHPPMLRSMGLKKKIEFGGWSRPIFNLLAKSRRLRGTRLDIFGYAEIRKTERQLISDYVADIERFVSGLNSDTLPIAVKLAELPDIVRGFEFVKMANVETYQIERRRLLSALA